MDGNDINTCSICNKNVKENIKERRLCTNYVDDKKNYLLSCHSCFVSRNDTYKEMWDEYRQSSIGY